MKFEKVIKIIEEIAPLTYGEEWDNTGIQINVGKEEIKKIMVVMDINDQVLDEGISQNVDLIVTHHPLIFSKLESIDINTVQGRYLLKAINNNISVYSAHLTFDNAPTGNNFYLAEALALENIRRPEKNKENFPGVIGKLKKERLLRDIGAEIVKKWGIEEAAVKMAGDIDKPISRIAICSGAGGDMLKVAIENKCQLLITADTKLHQAQKAIAEGICLIDAGHYDTEKQFGKNMAIQLRKKVGDKALIIESETNINPFIYL